MRCRLCEDFYDKHPLITDEHGELSHDLGDGLMSDPIVCAFETGIFSIRNWNCETIQFLRDYILQHDNAVWNLDHNMGVIKCLYDSGGEEFWSHLVLYWYKHRGKTDQAVLLSGNIIRPLTLEIAEKIIRNIRRQL